MNTRLTVIAGLWALAWVLIAISRAQGETYVFDQTSSAFEERVILNDILRACEARAAAGQNIPGYCITEVVNCVVRCTCSPDTAQKAAYVQANGPDEWLRAKRRELRQARRDEVCNLYKTTSDELRAQVDPLAGMSAIPTVASSESYSWTLVTTNPQERVIRNSLRAVCEAQRSGSQPVPAGCTEACDCSAATAGEKLDHLWREAFHTWFQSAWQRLRDERRTQFCGLYLDLDRAAQDNIDALLGLQALP